MNTQKNSNGNRFSSQIIIILIIAGAFAMGWFVSARLAGPGMTGMPPGMMGAGGPPVVKVLKVKKEYIEKEKEYIAHVEPIQQVDLVPRIEGYIAEVLFKEGSRVEKGQLLFTIDSREYRATVDLRLAELAQAEARQVRAEKYLQRLQSAETRSISQADMDMAVSDAQSAKAAVEMARASLKLAEIDLGYTRIAAPISGQIGLAEIKSGNYVSSASLRLARIVQTNPVRVRFSPADRHYLKLLEQDISGKSLKISSRVILPGGMAFNAAGQRDFVDNEMDPETGTITIWLRFDNPNGLLIPGSYVKLLLANPDRPKDLIIPQAAVVSDVQGHSVFIVDKEAKVHKRPITLGSVLEESFVVKSGLTEGESIVIEGVQKVMPGITVQVVHNAAPASKGKEK